MDILLVHLQDPGFSSSQFLRSSLPVQPRQPDYIRLHTQRWMELWLHAQSMPICCFNSAFIVCPTRMVRVPLCSQVHTELKGSIRILCLSSWLFTGSSSSSHRNILVHQKWGWFQGGGNVEESANFLNICKMELQNFRANHSYEICWINPIYLLSILCHKHQFQHLEHDYLQCEA